MSRNLLLPAIIGALYVSLPVAEADVRVPVKPLATRVQEADKVFVGVLINRKDLEGDWCHADLRVTQAIKGVMVGELVPVLWRPKIARYDANENQNGLAVLKPSHEKRYWLRSDTFEDAKLAEQAVESLKGAKSGKPAAEHKLPAGPKTPVIVYGSMQIFADGTVILGDRDKAGPPIKSKITIEELQELLSYILDENKFREFDVKSVKEKITAAEKAANEAAKETGVIRLSTRVADAPTTVLSVNADGKPHKVEYYALLWDARHHKEIDELQNLQAINQHMIKLRQKLRMSQK